MLKKSLKVLVLSSLLFTAACHRQVFTVDQNDNSGSLFMPHYESKNWMFINGLLPTARVNVAAKCGDKGVAKVKVKNGFLDIVIYSVTYGLVSPRTYQVQCKM